MKKLSTTPKGYFILLQLFAFCDFAISYYYIKTFNKHEKLLDE